MQPDEDNILQPEGLFEFTWLYPLDCNVPKANGCCPHGSSRRAGVLYT